MREPCGVTRLRKADGNPQPYAELALPPAGVLASPAQPPGGYLAPFAARGVGSAGQPALLPAVSRLVLQPVQQHCQPASTVALAGRVVQGEWRAGQQPPHLITPCPGGRPVRRPGACRESGAS